MISGAVLVAQPEISDVAISMYSTGGSAPRCPTSIITFVRYS